MTTVLLGLAIVLLVGGLFTAALLKGRRGKGVLAVLVSLGLFTYAGDRLDKDAKALGFASVADQTEATKAGFTDAVEWMQRRDQVRARQAAEEAEALKRAKLSEKRALIETATSAGINDIATYRAVAAIGVETADAYAKHLKREAFFKIPADQAAVIAAINVGRDGYRNAANDLVRGGARADRKREMCRHLRNRRARNWVGTIADLTTNSDGKGVIKIRIAEDVHVLTMNNAFSDIPFGTLLEPTSGLFRTLSTLAVGTQVKFSGRFFASDPDCVQEASLTLRGAMLDPEFVIRFSGVRVP